MSTLGYMYGTGQGVPQDQEEAVEWYRKGAAAGDLVSMDNLGRRYETGRGVQEDYCEGIRWYRKAAAGGLKESIDYLREIGEGSGSVIGGRWLTPAKLVFRFDVRGNAVFGEIQEGYGNRSIIGGKGYFDRVVMDGKLEGQTVTFYTVERFTRPEYSRNASGDTVSRNVEHQVKTATSARFRATTSSSSRNAMTEKTVLS